MRIRFTFPYGTEGWTEDRDMPAVPRLGDEVTFEAETEQEHGGVVSTVVWYPDDPDLDAYVVVKRP